ncbi:efflux RND transporter periplasmic adaptor subunit [Roseateles paludis]|uniref:Efflux RND transporter periplasmic adaptor subunit n=1 Tax=Roseateles paludis TaxID=3145238 RepID=A0ABV0FW48_9BURK
MRKALIVVALALLAGGLWWWKRPAPDVTAAAPTLGAPSAGGASAPAGPPQAVGAVKAQQQDVPVRLEATGTVTPLNTVDLRAQVTSTIAQVLVKEGQMVRKGELLFRFDDRADRALLEKARAQLARDRAQLADAERQQRRAQELVQQKFIAQSALDTALTNFEAAQALVKSDEVAVQAAQVQLSYSELRAPISGRVGSVNVYPGSLVQPASTATPLLNIAQLDPISIAFNVPETELAALLAAARAGSLSAEAVLPGSPRAPGNAPPLVGKVSFVDNAVDASTGTIKVKAEFDNKAQLLWPGQYLRVRLVLRTLKDAVVVPQAAIILRGQDRSVYVVDAEGKAKLVPIKLRQPFGELAAIEGIQPGEQVVLDGKQNLRPGTPLKVQPAQVNPAGGRPGGAASAASSPDSASGAAR